MALLMAVVVAASVTYLLYRRLRVNTGKKENMTQIVAAAKSLPAGVALTAKDVTLVDWPANVPLAGSFSKTSDVIGRPLIYPLENEEPILKRELAEEGSGIGLSTKIPNGMRATAVRSNEIVGVAGFLYPGSHVDVLVTYNTPGTKGPVTETVLQNVEVLAAGQTIAPDPQGKPHTVSVVTLLLSPEDSQKLLLSSSQGTIQFVLRSGIDQKKLDLTPIRLDQLVSVSKPARAVRVRRRREPEARPAPPPVFVMEVIQGTKRTVHDF